MPSRDDITIERVSPEQFGDAWPEIGPTILRGLSQDTSIGVLDTIDAIHAGKTQVWIARECGDLLGICLTERQDASVRAYCLAGRDLRKWALPLESAVVEYARLIGCRSLSWAGRRAWERLLPRAALKQSVHEHAEYEREVL
jgi:hypothetical protein